MVEVPNWWKLYCELYCETIRWIVNCNGQRLSTHDIHSYDIHSYSHDIHLIET